MYCNLLRTISEIDFSSCENATDIFAGCESLDFVGIRPGTLHTDISFKDTSLSISTLRTIISGLKNGLSARYPASITITGTPAVNDITITDEAEMASSGWTFII